jgi:hypothetical protein
MISPHIDPAIATAPLTLGQKTRLFFGALRVVLAMLPFVLYLVFLSGPFGPPPLMFYALALGALLLAGYGSLRALRDLLHGGVAIRDDVLIRSRASKSGRQCYGEFEALGKVRMSRKAHFGGRDGAAHRVTYSPISKYVWSAEAKAPYS